MSFLLNNVFLIFYLTYFRFYSNVFRSSKHHFIHSIFFWKQNYSRNMPRTHCNPNNNPLFLTMINFISSAIIKQESICWISILCIKRKRNRRKKGNSRKEWKSWCHCARKIYVSTRSPSHPDCTPPEDSAATKQRGRNIERPGDLSGRWNWLFSGERDVPPLKYT